MRLIDSPRQPLPLARYRVVLGRGPFALADERRTLARNRIDLLVSRASGGAAAAAKIVAAREAGLAVILVERPPAAAGERVAAPEAALEWIARRLAAGR